MNDSDPGRAVASDGSRRTALQFAHREMLDLGLIRVELGIIAGVVVLLAIVGPLGTDDGLSLLSRLAYWASCAVICWPFCHAQHAVTLYLVRSLAAYQIALAATIGALLMAVSCSAVGITIDRLFHPERPPLNFPDVFVMTAVVLVSCVALIDYLACQRVKLRFARGGGDMRTAAARTTSPPMRPQPSTAETALPANAATRAASPSAPVCDRSVGAGVTGGVEIAAPLTAKPGDRRGAGNGHGDTPLPAESPPAEPSMRLSARLPYKLGRDLVHVKADQHYINVVTSEGSALILMRFSDAVADLGDLGMQVHRSHWVAHRHVTGVVRRDGRILLGLNNGSEVPVSRDYRRAVSNAYTTPPPGDGVV